eukprot:34458_1
MAVLKQSYTWKIKDDLIEQVKSAQPSVGFKSSIFKMHNMKWYLRINPNGTDETEKGNASIWIFLVDFPSHLSKFEFRFQFKFIEGGQVYNNNSYWTKEYTNIGCAKLLQTDQLQQHDSFTFEVNIQIIQLYDVKGVKCDDEAEHKTSNGDALANARINSLETRMDQIFEMVKRISDKMEEDEKTNDNILNQMKTMKQEIMSLKQNMNSKDDKLKQWLAVDVGLAQYYDVFIENGVESLEIAKLITMETLKEMGIQKVGHRMQIIQKVVSLNQNGANVVNNIAYAGYEGQHIIDTNQ